MKKWKVLIIFINVFSYNILAENKILDEIVATVNNNIILKSDINSMMSLEKLKFKKTQLVINNNAFKNIILEKLIMDNLLLDIGKYLDITVNTKQVDEKIFLFAYQNKQTIDEFRNKLNKNGVSFDFYKKTLKQQLEILEIYKKVFYNKNILINKKEINSLYNYIINKINNNIYIHVNHFLLPLSVLDNKKYINEKKIIANKLVNKMKEGLNIVVLKKQYSNILDYFQIKDMGWIKINDLPNLFFNEIISARKNDILGPIISKTGFHILKINNIVGKNPNFLVEKIHIRHILLKKSKNTNNDVLYKKLINIRNDIKNNKNTFFYAAKQISEDTISSINGGDLGWFPVYNLEKNIYNEIKKLKKNQISKPILSSIGWHLIQIIDQDIFDNSKKIYQDQAYKLIFKRNFFNFFEYWVKEKKYNSYINTLNN